MFNWYVLYTSSGNEKQIKELLETQIKRANVQDLFETIVVPIVDTPEIKKGKKVMVEKKMFPGYILLKMIMNDSSWGLVKKVANKSGFLGDKNYPKALSKKEVDEIFNRLEKEKEYITNVAPYSVGDKVEILDGPFDSFSGLVDSVDLTNQRLKISVSIFGKATPIILKFTQVSKVES